MSNFGDAIQEYYVSRFRANAELRRRKIAALKDAADVHAYIAEVRARIAAAYDFPSEKCALDARVVDVIEKEEFSVRKVIFFSRPAFPVSATVYVPKKIKGKVPAVLVLCGHASEGKGADTYQSVAISLCLKGCVAMVPDPIGQGERFQYPDIDGFCNCSEHNLLNRRMLLTGDTFGAWRTYDAVRSVDFLLDMPEVDPDRVGVTGNSGGGTMTTLVNAVESRFAAAAPSCYITRWVRNVENELPVDAEQIPPGVARDGGDMADLLIAAAPRPLLILGQKNDFFDIRGTREVYEELKHIYTLLGCPERVGLFVGPTNHGYSIHNREAAYGFFGGCFKLGCDNREPEHTVFKPEELFCTPNGRTVELPGTVSVNTQIAARAKAQIAARSKHSEAGLRKLLAEMLGIGEVKVPYYRQLRGKYIPETKRGFSRYGLETEPGIIATLTSADLNGGFMHLPAAERTELYVPHQSALEELQKRPVPTDRKLFGIDYRGIGESMPDGCDQVGRDFFAYYQFDYHYDSLSLLLGESYLGGRVRDVIAAIKLLHAYGNPDITLTASGIGRIPALLAAFLCDEPVKLKLRTRIRTYKDSVLSEFDDLPQSMGIRGILKITDLDEIQDLVEKRN